MVRVGCSGWQYAHWRGDFYPAGVRTDEWLEHYASVFDTVELNNSFYRLPTEAAFAAWYRRTPPGFCFAVKASRYLTHMKKLKEPEEPLARFFGAARPLGPKLGPVLYQLPPGWPPDVPRLRAFVEQLPPGVRHVVEFRHPGWHSDAVLQVLDAHGVALCLHDMPGSAPPRMPIGPFVYVRFHGATRYGGRYGDEDLDDWARWLEPHVAAGRPVWAYFNNDLGGHAPRDAVRLRERLAAARVPVRLHG